MAGNGNIKLGRWPFTGPIIPILLVAAAAATYQWVIFATTVFHPGLITRNYVGIGADWMVFHGVSKLIIAGHLNSISNGDYLTQFLNKSYSAFLIQPLTYRPWVYPPTYLLFIVPFGELDFPISFALFQIMTALLLIGSIVIRPGSNMKSPWTLATLAILSPSSVTNILSGQNAFLIAAILVSGVRLLRGNEILAGAILSLVTVKPQFAILVPCALLAARRWRAFGSFVLCSGGLIALSGLIFGIEPYVNWINQTLLSLNPPSTQNPTLLWTEYGRMWGNSVWTCSVLLGATHGLSSILQLIGIVISVVAVSFAFYLSDDERVRLAVMLPAICLAAPYWSLYDSVFMVLGGLYWISSLRIQGSMLWPSILIFLVWLVPQFSPPIIAPIGRFTPFLILTQIFAALLPDFKRMGSPPMKRRSITSTEISPSPG